MTSNKTYRIEESQTRGKIVVAERDILPGELVVTEKEPILYFSDEFMSQYNAGGTGLESSMATFSKFRKVLTPAMKEKYMNLFGPTTGPTADNLRKFAQKMQVRWKEDDENIRFLTDNEVELFVKVAQIARLNMFSTDDDGHAVYEEITRFAHSCESNCDYSGRGRQLNCYAKRFIAAGEELTISYLCRRDLEPTHERRYNYVLAKDFTCHCPRCDALGDDPRQFDCFDPKCKGVMMVCQPISNVQFPIPGQKYTDVEYVEPHLLPCTVCHQTAPAEYQVKMFALEIKMLELGPRLEQRFQDMKNSHQHQVIHDFLKELHTIKIHRRHSAALPFLKTEYKVRHFLFLSQGALLAPAVGTAVSEYIAALEHILPNAHTYVMQEMRAVALVCRALRASQPPALSAQQEKDLCESSAHVSAAAGTKRARSHSRRMDAPVSREAAFVAIHGSVCFLRGVSVARGPHAESLRQVQAGDLLQC